MKESISHVHQNMNNNTIHPPPINLSPIHQPTDSQIPALPMTDNDHDQNQSQLQIQMNNIPQPPMANFVYDKYNLHEHHIHHQSTQSGSNLSGTMTFQPQQIHSQHHGSPVQHAPNINGISSSPINHDYMQPYIPLQLRHGANSGTITGTGGISSNNGRSSPVNHEYTQQYLQLRHGAHSGTGTGTGTGTDYYHYQYQVNRNNVSISPIPVPTHSTRPSKTFMQSETSTLPTIPGTGSSQKSKSKLSKSSTPNNQIIYQHPNQQHMMAMMSIMEHSPRQSLDGFVNVNNPMENDTFVHHHIVVAHHAITPHQHDPHPLPPPQSGTNSQRTSGIASISPQQHQMLMQTAQEIKEDASWYLKSPGSVLSGLSDLTATSQRSSRKFEGSVLTAKIENNHDDDTDHESETETHETKMNGYHLQKFSPNQQHLHQPQSSNEISLQLPMEQQFQRTMNYLANTSDNNEQSQFHHLGHNKNDTMISTDNINEASAIWTETNGSQKTIEFHGDKEIKNNNDHNDNGGMFGLDNIDE